MPWYAFTHCWLCSSHTRKLQVADQVLSETERVDLSQRLHQHVSASHAAEEIVLDDDGLWDKCLTARVEVWFERGAPPTATASCSAGGEDRDRDRDRDRPRSRSPRGRLMDLEQRVARLERIVEGHQRWS